MGEPGRDDEIRLVLPADPGYSRVARVAISGLAVRLGLSWPEVEDLRIAIDEALIFLLRPEGAGGEITFTFSIDDTTLQVDARSTAGADQHWDDAAARQRFVQIVGPLVDDHTAGEDGRHVRLVKQFGS